MAIEARSTPGQATVLVVDDDPLLADLIAEWVREKWDCVTVNSGSRALEVVDEGVDIVLLDRQLGDTSGEAVLEEIRDRGLPTQVMIVSGVEPDVDIVELAIDDYVQKPVDRPTIQEKIEGLVLRRTYEPTVEQYFVCVAKLEVLEETQSPAALAADEMYLRLRAKADELRQDAAATLGARTSPVANFQGIELDD
ncbi:MAG: response regulator [Halodesulfurarchaeum sp.]